MSGPYELRNEKGEPFFRLPVDDDTTGVVYHTKNETVRKIGKWFFQPGVIHNYGSKPKGERYLMLRFKQANNGACYVAIGDMADARKLLPTDKFMKFMEKAAKLTGCFMNDGVLWPLEEFDKYLTCWPELEARQNLEKTDGSPPEEFDFKPKTFDKGNYKYFSVDPDLL